MDRRQLVVALVASGCGRVAFDPTDGALVTDTAPLTLPCNELVPVPGLATGAIAMSATDLYAGAAGNGGVTITRWTRGADTLTLANETTLPPASAPLALVWTDRLVAVARSAGGGSTATFVSADLGTTIERPIAVDVFAAVPVDDGVAVIGGDASGLRFGFANPAGDVRAVGQIEGGGGWVAPRGASTATRFYLSHAHPPGVDPCAVDLIESWPTSVRFLDVLAQCDVMEIAPTATGLVSVLAGQDGMLHHATIAGDLLSLSAVVPLVAGSDPHMVRDAAGYLVTYRDAAGRLAAFGLDAAGAPTGSIASTTIAPASHALAAFGADAIAVAHAAGTSYAMRLCR